MSLFEPVARDENGDAIARDGEKWTIRHAVAYACEKAPLTMSADELADSTAHAFVGTNLGRDIVMHGLRAIAEGEVGELPKPRLKGRTAQEAAERAFERMPEAERVALLKVAMADLIQKYRQEVAVSNRTTIPDGGHR